MSQKLKVVTIGGGSSYTPELLEGFIKRYHELPVSELWLVDVEGGKAKLDIIFDLCQRMIDNAGVPMKLPNCALANYRRGNWMNVFH